MYAHFTAPENLPFAVALGLFLLVGIVQVVSLLTGANLFGWIDAVMPDIDAVGHIDVPETHLGIEGDGLDSISEASWVAKVFAWMNFGRVPFIISFMLLLFLFSCIGYNGQQALASIGLGPLPALLAAPLTLVVSIYPLRWGNALLGRIMPRDETTAVSVRTFIGRVATITLGEATFERAAEAKLRDVFGNTHYIMVRADREGMSFAAGEHVLIVSEESGHFTAIAVSNPNLDTE